MFITNRCIFAGFAIFEREVKGVVHYGVHAKTDGSAVPLGELHSAASKRLPCTCRTAALDLSATSPSTFISCCVRAHWHDCSGRSHSFSRRLFFVCSKRCVLQCCFRMSS